MFEGNVLKHRSNIEFVSQVTGGSCPSLFCKYVRRAFDSVPDHAFTITVCFFPSVVLSICTPGRSTPTLFLDRSRGSWAFDLRTIRKHHQPLARSLPNKATEQKQKYDPANNNAKFSHRGRSDSEKLKIVIYGSVVRNVRLGGGRHTWGVEFHQTEPLIVHNASARLSPPRFFLINTNKNVKKISHTSR